MFCCLVYPAVFVLARLCEVVLSPADAAFRPETPFCKLVNKLIFLPPYFMNSVKSHINDDATDCYLFLTLASHKSKKECTPYNHNLS